jgi:hypothetical protein
MSTRKKPTTARSMRVEDLMFLDDLRALRIPWIDRLAGPCASHEDVEEVWTLVRMWGPDYEDAMDILRLSPGAPDLMREVEKILCLIRLCEGYRS